MRALSEKHRKENFGIKQTKTKDKKAVHIE